MNTRRHTGHFASPPDHQISYVCWDEVVCPFCKRGPESRCTTYTGNATGPHLARLKYARLATEIWRVEGREPTEFMPSKPTP